MPRAAAIYALSDGALPLYPWGILLSFVFVLLYVLFGGILQMAWISVVNSVVMIAGSFLAMIMIAVWAGTHLLFEGASGMAAVESVYASQGATAKLSQFSMLGSFELWFGLIIPVIFLHLTAAGVSQPHNMPFFAAKTEQGLPQGHLFGFGHQHHVRRALGGYRPYRSGGSRGGGRGRRSPGQADRAHYGPAGPAQTHRRHIDGLVVVRNPVPRPEPLFWAMRR